MDDNFYYESLRWQDELLEKLVAKYGGIRQASMAFGRDDSFFYSSGRLSKVSTMLKACQMVDISIDTALGITKNEKYKPIEITFSGLIREYDKHKYLHKNTKQMRSLSGCVCELKNTSRNDMLITTLLKFIRLYKKSASYLIS